MVAWPLWLLLKSFCRISSSAVNHFSFEDFPAWGSLYGLLSCVAIIVVSKLIGKLWLMHREDHYDS